MASERRWLAVVVLAGLAVGLGHRESVAAQSPGLDLVVVVDQSGSMTGVRTEVESDPYSIRNHMVTWALELLIKSARHHGLEHRLGVVSFGSRVRVDLPLARVPIDDFGQLRSVVERIASRPSLGDTDFLAAFEEAARQFAQLPPSEAGRRRALLLITDGAPNVRDIEIPVYQAELGRLSASRFPAPEYRIEVVALNAPGSDYWKRYRRLWREISHDHARQLNGDQYQVYEGIREVIMDLVKIDHTLVIPGPVEVLSGGTESPLYSELPLPPYLDSVVFDFFSLEPGLEVAVFPPSSPNEPLTEDSPGVEFGKIGGILRSVTVRRPEPGLWLFRKSHPKAQVKIYSQQFFPRGKLVEPSSKDSLRQYDRVWARYRLADGEDKPIRELPGYPLELELSLRRPDGSARRLAMEATPETDDGSFRSLERVDLDQAGRYRTEIRVITKDFSGHPITIYEDRWSGFEVASAKRIDCSISAPRSGERIPLYGAVVFWPRPVSLRLECREEGGEPVNMEALIGGSVVALFAARLKHRGQPVPSTAELAYQEAGVFEGRLDGAEWLGEYQLELVAEGDRIPEPYTLVVSPSELRLERTLTWWHWLEFALLALAVASLLIFVGRRLWLLWRAPLRGSLFIDRLDTGQEVKALSLTEGRRRNRRRLTDLPLETQLDWLDVRAVPGRSPTITVSASLGGKALFARPRVLRDKEQIVIPKIPYRLKYHH